MAKQELLATIRARYRASSKKDKNRILDEFIAVTGHHRRCVLASGDLPRTKIRVGPQITSSRF